MPGPSENFDGDPSDDYAYDDSQETPATARARVARAGNRLVQAELALKRARDAEVDLELEYEKQRRQLMFSTAAPKVGRGEGFVTVSERDGWLDSRLADLIQAKELARVARETAQQHYRRVDSQASLAQSILNSIDKAFAIGIRNVDR